MNVVAHLTLPKLSIKQERLGEERMSEFLKIKIKSLAAESRVIRDRERKASGLLRQELHNHRVHVVRKATRSTLLAYGFLRRRTYSQIEKTCKTTPNFHEVERMVLKYYEGEFEKQKLKDALAEWFVHT